MTDQSRIIGHAALAGALVAGGKGEDMQRAGVGPAGPDETANMTITG